MADTSAKTFPGVYTQIIDQSFITERTSRFRPGLIGVCSKGLFDTPIKVRSLKEFVMTFGRPITGSYNANGTPSDNGFYLADAVSMIADFTNDMTVVRVGNRYAALDQADGVGTAGAGSFTTNLNQAAVVNALLSSDPSGQLYLSLKEDGKASTVNVPVLSASGSIVALDGETLSATYIGASLGYSKYGSAANKAEGVVYAYTYGSDSTMLTDFPMTTYGAVTGSKNAYQFVVAANWSTLTVGGVYKIKQTGNYSETPEVRIKQVLNGTIVLETSDSTRLGYQAVALQDTYTSGVLYKATGRVPFLWVEATTEGEWANGANSKTGLYIRVRPGSAPGSKKMEVFVDGGLAETHDNLSNDPTSSNFYTTRINDISQYVYIVNADDTDTYHAANTAAPWDVNYYGTNAGPPLGMPTGAINAGILSASGTTWSTGGQFTQGYNGNNAQEADFVGTYDPATDTFTGLKAFEDIDNVDINLLAAPMDSANFGTNATVAGMAVMQEMARVARKVNALALADVPPDLNPWEAIDWHNGTGRWTGRGRIDDANIAIYWNWFRMTDRFTGLIKLVPPTLATLRAMAFTFDRDKPWYAAAGENRGFIPEALSVQYEKVSNDVRQAMYGAGNSVNPLLRIRGRYLLYGERTMQRAESKLTAVHSVILVNYVVDGLADVARKFVFDPNDLELLIHIRLAFTEFLDKVRNERGIEEYELVVDDRNNTADTRNHREVIVDLAIVPTDVAERIFINATVRESGATLNNVNT